MLPVNSRWPNKFVAYLYSKAAKQCLHQKQDTKVVLGSNNICLSNHSHFRQYNADSKDQQQAQKSKLPPLATSYFNQFQSYCQMISDAKGTARRSVLIDHCDNDDIELGPEFTNIERIYSIKNETVRGVNRLSLIEFKNEEDAERISRTALHSEGLLPVPLKILQYRSLIKLNLPPCKQNYPIHRVRLSHKHEMSPKVETYSQFLAGNMISLVALKLRFITLVNIERVVCNGMFEEFELMPFGSSVIDFGSDSGDLDLLMTRKVDHNQFIRASLPSSGKQAPQDWARPQVNLVHLDKSIYRETKDPSGIRGILRLFDLVLREFTPLIDAHDVLSLPHAKVPIIKFKARVTELDCDLSFNLGLDQGDSANYSGVIMSHFLYLICRNTNLFAAIVVYLRVYAKLTAITCKGSSVKFTNFQLLSLIVFYLQQISVNTDKRGNYRIAYVSSYVDKPIVPPFRQLLDQNFSLQTRPTSHYREEQLEELVPLIVRGFFSFYSDFDFERRSVNLFESRVQRKLDNSPIYVTNPIDQSRNVCYNVQRRGLDGFMKQLKASLDSQDDPLAIMRNLLIHNQKQAKSNRARFLDAPVTMENIAQDVFR